MEHADFLKKMETYMGKDNPPSDFDEFWNKQISSLPESISYEIKPRHFGVENTDFFDLYFRGTNNGTVHAKCIFPHHQKNVPVVFYFHGYMGQAPDWTSFLKYIPLGVGVVAMDVRGQQGESVDNGIYKGNTVLGHIIRGAVEGKDHLFYKDIYLDVYSLIEVVADMERVDNSHLYTWGGSQGGALSLIGAALNHRIRRCATQYPFLSDFKYVLEMGDMGLPYDELFRYFKFYDPFHKTEAKLLKTLSYIDVKNFAHLIRCPVLMFTGLEDKVCFPATQYAIYNRIETEKKHILLPEYEHEAMFYYVDSTAFNWLFGTNFPEGPNE